jgi:hypothetical protein
MLMPARKTHVQFENEIESLVGNEYTILEQYSNNSTKIKFKHNVCGYSWYVNPGNFLMGSRCPNCKNKKTTTQFKAEVFNLVGDEYLVLGEYTGVNNHLLIKHNALGCGHEYMVKPSNFLLGYRCVVCANLKNRKTHNEFLDDVYSLVGDDYSVMSEYLHSLEPVDMLHSKCGNIYSVKPSFFLGGNRCPKCARNSKKTTSQYKSDVYDLVGSEYVVLGEYKHSKSKINKLHVKCGSEFLVAPNDFLRGGRCPHCSPVAMKTTEQFKQDVYNLVQDEYIVLGEYKGVKRKLTMRHCIENCNYEWDILPTNFLKGTRCPKCCESKGEKRISDFLDKYKVNYKRQYRIDECRNIYPLPFDFAIFDERDQLLYLIEYDGVQHFIPIETFGGNERFNYTRENDQIKSKFCNKNNLNLIRISYLDFENIDEILLKIPNISYQECSRQHSFFYVGKNQKEINKCI